MQSTSGKTPCTYCNDSGWVMISKPGAMDSKGNLHMIQFPNPCYACHAYERWKASLNQQKTMEGK